MSKPSTTIRHATIPQLESHTARLRSRIDETLVELGHQLTPARLGRMAAVKAGTSIARGSGGMARSARRHPRAALALGIGIVGAWWLRRFMRR